MMKLCKRCLTEKPITEFYRHAAMADGYLSFCKDCTKKRVARHREQNIEYVRWYDRERNRLPQRQALRDDFNAANPDKCAAAIERWEEKHPLAVAAHEMVAVALKRGWLVKEPCVKCGNTDSHAHHEDYSKPLDVIWLCAKHHGERHRELNEQKRKSCEAFEPG